MRKRKKLLSKALSTIALISMLTTAFSVSALAAEPHDGFTALDDPYTTVLDGGKYYLSEDLKMDRSIAINGDVTLCLHGNTMQTLSTITVKPGASLTVCDCETDGKIKLSAIDTNNAKAIVVNDGTFTLESGTVELLASDSVNQFDPSAAIHVSGGKLNIKGGTVTSNVDTIRGLKKSVIDIKNGSVVTTASSDRYAIVALDETVVNISGGNAFNVCLDSDAASATLSGGTIAQGVAAKKCDRLTITKDVQIKSDKVGVKVEGNNSKFVMDGGTIHAAGYGLEVGNVKSADVAGGNISGSYGIFCNGKDVDITVSSGTIKGTSEAGILFQGDNLNIAHATVSGATYGIELNEMFDYDVCKLHVGEGSKVTGGTAGVILCAADRFSAKDYAGDVMTVVSRESTVWNDGDIVISDVADEKKFAVTIKDKQVIMDGENLIIGTPRNTNPPVISGVEDGKTYCEDKTITVTDDEGEVTVTVDGKEVTLTKDGKYTLTKGKHTVTATDKSGNTTTVEVTINDSHSLTDGVCDICGKDFNTGNGGGNNGSADHKHDNSGAWVSDIEDHWKICEDCGEILEAAGHTPDKNGECTVCHKGGLTPAKDNSSAESSNTGDTTSVIPWLILMGVAATVATVTVIRRKRQEEAK